MLRDYQERIVQVHFKDYSPQVAARAASEAWDYFEAVGHGVFCELGQGAVPFQAVRDALIAMHYDGWVVVEQDVLPALGSPLASARRNHNYMVRLGMA
jgi:inosose dehydratase